MAQVLEACWGRFMDRLPHAANLEALIAAHSTFLEGLLKGALLGGSASAQTGDLQAELQAALRSVAQLPNPVGKLQELVSGYPLVKIKKVKQKSKLPWLCQAWLMQNPTTNGPQRDYQVGHQTQTG